MGDGGVACMPLQQHTNIMERFPDMTTSHCPAATTAAAGAAATGTASKAADSAVGAAAAASTAVDAKEESKSNGNKNGAAAATATTTTTSNGTGLKTKRVVKRIVKVKKVVTVKKPVGGAGSDKARKVVENGTTSAVSKVQGNKDGANLVTSKVQGNKEEVEEGELGTLKSPPRMEVEKENGESAGSQEKPKRSEVEREDGNGEKLRREEMARGEAVPGKLSRKGDASREDFEKGEIIPDRWQSKGCEYGSSKARSRHEMSGDQSPPGKFCSEDSSRRKDISRSGNMQLSKNAMRWEGGHDRSTGRISSRSVDEEGSYKGDYSNGRSHGREHPLGNRLKRLGTDLGGIDRKLFGDYEDYMGSKSRRIGEDGYRTANSEYYSRHTADKFYKGSGSSSSRIFASDKHSTRHHEPTLSSKVVYDRHGRSPAHNERSPLERGRFYDPRDRSPLPLRRDRSPFGRERSPYGGERTPFTRERSPYGGERTPFVRDRSPYGGERTPYGRERSPYGGERTPYGRERSPYGRDRSPYGGERTVHGREKSPYGRERSPLSRGKSPFPRDKSPYDRVRNYENRCRSPVYSERSPQDKGRHHSRRDRVPNVLERSPPDRSKPDGHREASRKGGAGEKKSSQNISKRHEDKVVNKNLSAPDIPVHDKVAEDRPDAQVPGGTEKKDAICESHIGVESQIPSVDECTHADGPPHEEFLSMEEDMDICDTPPHVPAVPHVLAVPHVPLMPDSSMGNWYYLDYFGVEQGPSRLFDLKALVDDGVLLSDHFVKHMDTDRWVTIEKAVSPVMASNFPSIFPEAVTQLVTPPEAPGNVLTDNGDTGQVSLQNIEDRPTTSLQTQGCACNSTAASEPLKDLKVDERVGSLLEGFAMVPGRELETIGEVLQMTFDHVPSEEWGMPEGYTWRQTCSSAHDGDELSLCDMKGKEDLEEHQIALLDPDQGFGCSFDVVDWFSGPWSCKGGDWKRQDDAVNERILRRKLVLNDGFPLCLMPKTGCEDPRWHRKDDLYYPSQSKRLDLPVWGFSWLDEKSDVAGRLAPTKPPVVRGVKGTTLPVIRINACVVKDHGSFISESRSKVRGKDKHTSRSARMSSAANDGNRSAVEGEFLCKVGDEQESNSALKSNVSIAVPKDRLCSVHDLQLHLGDWYYLDGAGHVQGPRLYSELQALVDQGVIQNHSSVFRKSDRLWVPVTSAAERSDPELKYQVDSATPLIDSSSFHGFHPQFVGYTRGKLHELVMKAYKSREFAAAINEVLDPWISSKLPKKDSVRDFDGRAGKRPWLQDDDSGENCELDENLHTVQNDETPFEELCGDSSFSRDETAYSGVENGSWGLLDGHMLARVFHFLRLDMKSLALASLTCKHWRAAVAFYKDISQHVDFSSFGPGCNDFMIWNVLNVYNRQRIKSMVLVGCTSITSSMLEQIVRSFPHLSSVDIRGCGQFGELVHQFPNVSWINSRYSRGATISDESHFSKKNLKRKTEHGSDTNDFNLTEYIESGNNRDSANQLFRRSLYKRSKLFDARKSSSIVSRDARTSRWSLKKSEIWPKKMEEYNRMEEFLSLGLRDVMKLNTFDFFVSKVSEMEERMKSGYYLKHGFGSVKNDIMRMCKEARKARIRGSGDINHTIDLFFKLVSLLGKSSKLSYDKDQLVKAWKEDLTTGSTSMRNRKSTGRHMLRNNGSISANGSFDHGEGLTDREARKGASKWNKKAMDSGTDSSDDFGSSFLRGDSESTASDTESDSDFRPESQTGESRGDGCSTTDESCVTDEREWGARMTKASLVPPVTRKYEVIDRYVIVADEEDVQRKMSVSLPDDYAEKLDAQKNGTEELDMELPEVKDYKPRKELGEEVIEQEVYGIDPYTHNLLLDSMPEELGWTLSEKHMFIEDVLLRTLNKQVRCFTGTGNTPMIFPLQPVLEEIEKVTARDSDTRTTKMCRNILRSIDSRRDDRYVAYRKGLGVVCNKDGGFGEEDFVVEFLGEVYPAWKWFEKQDGIRSLQKDSQDPAPEFYNIYLERPKGDADGYDLVVVDAMHKANYASRICHSCRPNCEAKVTAVGGQYQIGIYAVREIQCGEEVTFDYNSVTESKEEYEASVCLCGSQVCRGSYLNLTGEGAFQKVLKKCHGMLDRHRLMIEACQLNSVSEDDYLELGRAGLGSCLLGGLPGWVVAYSARLVRFINRERTKLPKEILRHNLEEKRKYFSDICMEVERSDAEVQAEGVYNQRLQNLAVTLDKVRYVMRCLFGDPKKAPPPLEKLSPEETVSFLWKGEGSLVEELLQCMAPLLEPDVLSSLKSKIQAHDPSDSDDMCRALRKSLLWLRDELRSLPCTDQCQHDAAADLIHVYACTKFFFRVRKYMTFTSPPVYISPLDLGPIYAEKLGPSNHEYRKTYGENYCLGQLIFWHVQTNVEPDCSLDAAIKGCLSLPNVASFYTTAEKRPRDRSNGSRLLRAMLERMEKRPQKPWPKDQLWSFKNFPDVIGSPMLDAILNDNSSLDKEMISWLKQRPSVFQHT